MGNKAQTFIFYGLVGSGKGTQVNLLKKYLEDNGKATDLLFISTGEEFRKIAKENNLTSSIIHDSVENGILIPDFLTTSLVVNKIKDNIKENSIIISDGYPRTVEQSKSFEQILNFYGRSSVNIIYLELSKEEALKRMKLRGRADDTKEGISNRFDEYEKNVIPSMNYFEGKNGYTIFKIDGSKTIGEVHEEIISKIKSYL